MMTVKISLGIFFARIVVARWHIMLIYVTIGVNMCSSVAAFFYCILRCGPDVERYALQQLKNQCTSRGLDRFMAYQSGRSIPDSRIERCTNEAVDSYVFHPH